MKDLASNLAAMALNVVGDQISIFKSTPWLNVQLRHVVGNLVGNFDFQDKMVVNLVFWTLCGAFFYLFPTRDIPMTGVFETFPKCQKLTKRWFLFGFQ